MQPLQKCHTASTIATTDASSAGYFANSALSLMALESCPNAPSAISADVSRNTIEAILRTVVSLRRRNGQGLARFEQGLQARDDRRPPALDLSRGQRRVFHFVRDGELAVLAVFLDDVAHRRQLVTERRIPVHAPGMHELVRRLAFEHF